MLMLIDTADSRYGGGEGPDDERERRWQPISRRLFVPAAGSVSCLIASVVSDPLISVLLVAIALVLCAQFVRAAMHDAATADGPPAAGDDAR